MSENIDWESVEAKPPPKKLYRYSPDRHWTEETIRKRELYLSSPNDFNDPFDCQIRCHFSGNPAEAGRITKDILAGSKKMRSKPPKKRLQTFSPAVKAAKEGILFRPDQLEARLRGRMSNDGITCFCEDPLSILMWSYYAEKHTGICLEFDTELGSWIGAARQVQYAEEYPELRFVGQDWLRIFSRLILTKAQEWKHEKEWRFFSEEPPYNRKLAFPPNALTGVIFGARMQPDRKAELARKISAMPFAPSLSELIISKEEFELVQRPYLA